MWLDARYPCPEQVKTAIRAIGPKAIPTLLRKTTKPPLYDRVFGILPIEVQCLLPRPDNGFLARNRIVCALSLIGAAAVPQLQGALKDANGDVKQVALRAIALIGAEADPAGQRIGELLKNPDVGVRLTAVNTLRKLGPGRHQAIPALVEALQDSDNNADILVAAAGVLGAIGPDARVAVLPLKDLLDDNSEELRVRYEAAFALGRINGDPNAIAFLIGRLENFRKAWKYPQVPRWGFVEPQRDWDPSLGTVQSQTEALLNEMPSGPTEGLATCLRIFEELGEMHASAKPALPVILEVIRKPTFHPSVEAIRPKIVDAAQEALNKIDPEAAEKHDAGPTQ